MIGESTVHIVDDDAAIRRAMVRLLRSAGLASVAYEGARAILNAAPDLSSGCILLDVRMPGMDGLELLARMDEFGIDLPVIVLTGHSDVPTAVKAMKAGAVDFIEKPIDEDQLLGAIPMPRSQKRSLARGVARWHARDQALKAGALGYLVKPFEETDLLSAINLALHRQEGVPRSLRALH